jgi:hypothetical protein
MFVGDRALGAVGGFPVKPMASADPIPNAQTLTFGTSA